MSASLFRSAQVRLSAIREEDGDRLAAWYDDAEFLRRYAADPAMPRSGRDIAAWLLAQKPPHNFLFAIRLAAEDGFYGIMGLDGVLPFQGVAGLHVAVGRPHWGQGVGRDALSLMLGYAFGELNLRRVQLTVFRDNLRAIRPYEGPGFQREGGYREFLQRDGQLYAMYLYGLLHQQWEARLAQPH
jgi:RimJ/RimL family protein N-acetyltransferase